MSTAAALPREEYLRASRRDALPWPGSKWRGWSNRIYVVTIRSIAEAEAGDLPGSVVIAVRRDGIGQIARVTAISDAAAAHAFMANLPKAVSELHLHRIEPDARKRAAIVADLQPE